MSQNEFDLPTDLQVESKKDLTELDKQKVKEALENLRESIGSMNTAYVTKQASMNDHQSKKQIDLSMEKLKKALTLINI